jgi:phage terminase large subunit GpA-like protein
MREPDYRRDKGQLPPYASAWGCVLDALPALGPAQRISVPAAAAKYRTVDAPGYRGPWVNETAPYMVEPAEMMTSRRYQGVIFVGPARTLKTDALLVNTVLHRVIAQPRDMLVVHMNQMSARKFSMQTISKLIRDNPEVRRRLALGRSADNIYDKRFAGGMLLSIGWPVIGQVSATTLSDVLITDFDRMPDDIDGEGSLWSLAKKRLESAGSLGKALAESSPGRPVLDADWVPGTPHEAPPTTGILSIYQQGTRGRLYWPCPQCEEEYEPRFAYLNWPKGASPVEAGEQVTMICPCCGYPTPPQLKSELIGYSRWLHETAEARWVEVDGRKKAVGLTPIDGNVRSATAASYWMFGPAARFQTWQKLVTEYLQAEEIYQRTGDEQALKTTVNVDDGSAYRPKAMGTASLMTRDEIRKRAVKLDGKLAPSATRFITMQCDVQNNRFVVQVDAWGEGLERWMIDRFELFIVPGQDERALDPARYAADWDVLLSLVERTYEVDGTGYALKPAFLVTDSAGESGVTANAYAFWRRVKKKGLGQRFMLVRGNHVKKGLPEEQRRAYIAFPERSTENGKKTTLDVPVIWVGTDALKDEISAALTRDEFGTGAYRVLDRVDDRVFEELAAEMWTPEGWKPKPGVKRNEALDLSVYGKAVVLVKGGEKIDWTNPPNWAAPMPSNFYAVAIEGAAVMAPPVASIEPEPPKPVAPVRQSSWLGGRQRGFLKR